MPVSVMVLSSCCDESRDRAESRRAGRAERSGSREISDQEALERAIDLCNALGVDLHDAHQCLKVVDRADDALEGRVVRVLGPVSVTLSARTGHVVSFRRRFRWSDSGDGLPPAVSSPKWTRDQVVAAAQHVLAQIVPAGQEARLSDPTFVWVPTDTRSVELRRLRLGAWEVRWPRRLGPYEFDVDKVIMQVHEDLGVLHVGVNFRSKECPLEVKVSSADARRIAEGERFRCAAMVEYYTRAKGVGPLVAQRLLIVRPNVRFKVGANPEDVDPTSARLAYEFRWARPGTDSESEWMLSIWIDAATGENLGGTFK